MFYGIGVSEGIGIGRVFIIKEENIIPVRNTNIDIDREISRYSLSVDKYAEIMGEKSRASGDSEAAILLGHCAIAQDPELYAAVSSNIKSEHVNAEIAVQNAFRQFISMFEEMDDELLSERALDLKDIKNKLIRILMGLPLEDINEIPEGSILVAKELTPSVTAGINPGKVEGFITETGGAMSHTAIIARFLEIPAVTGVTDITGTVKNGDLLIIDGNAGKIFVAPDEETVNLYFEKKKVRAEEKNSLKKYKNQKTVTKDGTKVELCANIGRVSDLDKVIENDAEGIGLFRTEFLYMDNERIPSEEEQFKAYKTVAVTMQQKFLNDPQDTNLHDRSIIIRTLDVGGDKEIKYLGLKKEENPFLGFRAVRYSLKNIEIFKSQIRAILRAAVFGNIKIMIPMISDINEFREIKKIINEVKACLLAEKIEFRSDVKVGMMIETPSAAILADVIAKEADFFSIGTNDLTQYTMAVDRGNENVSNLYTHYSPSVVRLIKMTIEAARKNNIPVGMCGEAASDPLFVPYLVALGIDELSVSAPNVLKVRKTINNMNISEIKDSILKISDMATAGEIETALKAIQF